MLFVNGELRIIYMGADESIIKKVDEAFRQIGYRYDFDHARLKKGVKVNGWGNEGYSEARIKKLLESLREIAPIEDGSEFDFYDGDSNYWRYIFVNGAWKYQTGKLVYEDCELMR
jgi:hypothetical protein